MCSKRGSCWAGDLSFGKKIRAETWGSVEMITSLDWTPVSGSSEGGIFLHCGLNNSTRPSLYTWKNLNSRATSSSIDVAIDPKEKDLI